MTEQSIGESLKNFTFGKGFLVIADRAYGTINRIEHCLSSGSDFMIRIKNKAFHLYDSKGEKSIYTDWLKTVGETAAERTVYLKTKSKGSVPLRICAARKTEEEIRKEEKRRKQLESKKQRKYSKETKFTHRYMFVIPSLPPEVSAQEVLSCYRLRWQVELVFQRLKSLLQLGSIPTKTKESEEVWINGKILLSLLTEKYLGDVDFSPSWDIQTGEEHRERNKAGIVFNFYDDTSQYTNNIL